MVCSHAYGPREALEILELTHKILGIRIYDLSYGMFFMQIDLQPVLEKNNTFLPVVSKELAYDMSEVPAVHHQNPWLQGLFSSISTIKGPLWEREMPIEFHLYILVASYQT